MNNNLVDKYCFQHSNEESNLQIKIRNWTYKNERYPQMISGSMVGNFLGFLIKSISAKKILEVGMFTGYSAASMAKVLPEDGEMLVICYDSFCDETQEFVDWKNQKGIKTTLVSKSEAGSNVSSIKSYITNFYNSHDLTYVLLVGDKNQIPSQ